MVVGVAAFWGAWTRRWISDDGLIVLRTVRNLLAGNGPVFNAGERVETNTSTLWQYVILVGHWITGASLAAVAMYAAIALSVAAMALGCWATARIHPGRALIVPAGAFVYLALPPARDFFTSGLEWGLSIFYLAVLWWLLVRWAAGASPYLLAFVAGLSWLVRPELALYGGIVGIVLLVAHRSRGEWMGILAAALPLPAGYQIFRMGYYGLLTPHTAVAKSASGARWGNGFAYLSDFIGPYWLWLPVLVLAGVCAWSFRRALWRQQLRSVTTIVSLMELCALLHTLYVLRVGGDFMHGRMLLLPLFAGLLPVFVIPLRNRLLAAVAAGIGVWALIIVWRGHPVDWASFDAPKISIVDEREFWTYATRRAPGDGPKNEVDFRQTKFMTEFDQAMEELQAGGAISLRYLKSEEPETYGWDTIEREPGRTDPPTLYLINLGMTSMNAPLDVRVLDNIGLATPLAARQPRIEGGRIGHDKNLAREWQVADTAVDIDKLPSWIDHDKAKAAREALQTPQFQELFATYRDPLTLRRFVENIKFSLTDGRTMQFSDDPYTYLR